MKENDDEFYACKIESFLYIYNTKRLTSIDVYFQQRFNLKIK